MTDILYIVRQSGWGYDEELRYALRSVAMYGHNVGNVYVCGDIPDFLSDRVKTISCNNPFDRKSKNLTYRLLYAIENSDIGAHFLLSSDDIFLTKPTDFDSYPHYWKNGATISVPEELREAKIGRIINSAAAFLQAHGFSLNDYGGGHVLHHIYRGVLNNIQGVIDEAQRTTYGVPVDLLTGAANDKYLQISHTKRTDIKIECAEDEVLLKGCDCFSMDDKPQLWGGDKILQKLFPNKCIYEK